MKHRNEISLNISQAPQELAQGANANQNQINERSILATLQLRHAGQRTTLYTLGTSCYWGLKNLERMIKGVGRTSTTFKIIYDSAESK